MKLVRVRVRSTSPAQRHYTGRLEEIEYAPLALHSTPYHRKRLMTIYEASAVAVKKTFSKFFVNSSSGRWQLAKAI
jgi:hypothetical protein